MMSPSHKEGVLYPKMTMKPPFTVEVPGAKAKEGETVPRRHPNAKDGLIIRPAPDVNTPYDIVRRGAEKFGNAKAIGTRRLIKTHVENKKVKKIIDGQEQEVEKKWTYFELSGYTYKTFIEYEAQVNQLGAGLKNLGLEKGNRLHLYGATRYVIVLLRLNTDLWKLINPFTCLLVRIGWLWHMVSPTPDSPGAFIGIAY